MAYSCLYIVRSRTKQNATLVIHFSFSFLSSICGCQKVVMLLTTLRGIIIIIPTPTSKVPKFHLSILYIQVPMRNKTKAFSSLWRTGYSASPGLLFHDECPLPSIVTLPWNRNHLPVSKASIYVTPRNCKCPTENIYPQKIRQHWTSNGKKWWYANFKVHYNKKKPSMFLPSIKELLQVNVTLKLTCSPRHCSLMELSMFLPSLKELRQMNVTLKLSFTDGVIHVPPIHKWTPTSECDIETSSKALFTDGINWCNTKSHAW